MDLLSDEIVMMIIESNSWTWRETRAILLTNKTLNRLVKSSLRFKVTVPFVENEESFVMKTRLRAIQAINPNATVTVPMFPSFFYLLCLSLGKDSTLNVIALFRPSVTYVNMDFSAARSVIIFLQNGKNAICMPKGHDFVRLELVHGQSPKMYNDIGTACSLLKIKPSVCTYTCTHAYVPTLSGEEFLSRPTFPTVDVAVFSHFRHQELISQLDSCRIPYFPNANKIVFDELETNRNFRRSDLVRIAGDKQWTADSPHFSTIYKHGLLNDGI